MYSGKRSIFTRYVCRLQHVRIGFGRRAAIIRCLRHRANMDAYHVVRKDSLELKMIERRLDGAGTIDRSHNEIAQAADRARRDLRG